MSHIRLGAVAPADAPDLIAANRANVDYHAPWVSSFTDAPGFAAWAAAEPKRVSFLARRAADGAPVGLFNISQIVMGNFCSAYLGFCGYRETGGQGLVTAALRAVLAEAFGPLGLHRLEANIQPGNVRSLALVARAGFLREGFSPGYLKINGEWRDHERWAARAP